MTNFSRSTNIRTIQQGDNPAIAAVIRATLKEFGADKPGTVFYDPTTDNLYELFQQPRSVYYIAELDGSIVGGCGIFPTEGLPTGTCELVKMYLMPAARGIGLGRTLIEHSINFAREEGYTSIYLESMPELAQALKVYARFGFQYIDKPLGNSGHFGCPLWMLKTL